MQLPGEVVKIVALRRFLSQMMSHGKYFSLICSKSNDFGNQLFIFMYFTWELVEITIVSEVTGAVLV